jgi:hypothetical protein
MGNDKQIKKDLTNAGSRFLPEEIANVDGGAEVYSLEKEFEKTRKNKNWAVMIIVLVFFAIIASITALFTYYTELENSKIEVNISEFEDVRLKEVLGNARMSGNTILIRKNELNTLVIEMKSALLGVNSRYLAAKNAVLDRGLSPEAEARELAELKRSEERELAKIRADYDKKIASKRSVIREIEKEQREAERKLKEEAENLAKFGDESKVYELKMKTLSKTQKSGVDAMRDYYERYIRYLTLKYNPVFSSGESKALLQRSSRLAGEKQNLRSYDEVFASENIWSRKRFDELRDKINDFDSLLRRLAGVDYTNSVPPALKGMDKLSTSIINDYENFWYSLTSALKNKNRQIEDYKKALDAVLKERPESGYIISPADPAKVSIHINRLIPVKEGDRGLIFRTDDEYIGRIELFRTADGFKGKIVSIEPGKTMKPFDRILMKVK